MSKVAKRLLLFFIGLPIVMAIVYVKFLNHLPLQLVIAAASVLSANEFYNMLRKKSKLFPKPFILIGAALQPYCAYFFILFGLPMELTLWVFVLEAIILMVISILSKTFTDSVIKISNSLLIIFYCGFLVTFLSRMTILDNSRYWIALFLILVFMCDSFAWLFGVLFGKNNRGYIPASPNKSIVGFIGGILGAIACGVLFKFYFEDVVIYSYWRVIVLGFITSIAGIIGDLIESVIKRSLDSKDSGNLIPGRGGLLDSIDSIIIAAPVYYAGIYFLFGIA
ncbi:MAG: phosphatidate cytidylyltransferase [Treponema sp.]|nr:phosphatidate cytidylyltransferase [Treponema sp.]